MRTTIRLNDELLQQAKSVALASGKTLNDVIEDAVRESMARRKSVKSRKRISLPTVGGRGARPGVDIYDSASLLELMDELDDASSGR